MSHFAVLVILPTEPTEAAIAKALQPFHEYECTGIDDQYVIDVDMTDEVNADWLKPVKVVRLTDGTLHSRWDDKFYTGEPARKDRFDDRKTFELPPGAAEEEVPQNEAGEYADIVAFATEYHSYEHRDGKFFRHTNPNSHWDWYQLGGRYSGKLRTLSGSVVKGKAGLMGSQEDPNGVDVSRRDDLDFATMKMARIGQRITWLDDIKAKSGFGADDLDRALRLQPTVSAAWQALKTKPRDNEYHDWIEATFGDDGKLLAHANRSCWDLPALGQHATATDWAKAAPPLTCWAVVKDGQWIEKGAMGWWGISTGDMDQDEWEQRVTDMVGTLPADHWLAVVDCHI